MKIKTKRVKNKYYDFDEISIRTKKHYVMFTFYSIKHWTRFWYWRVQNRMLVTPTFDVLWG